MFKTSIITGGNVTVYTNDFSKEGNYYIRVTCWWAEVPSYKVTFLASIDVGRLCKQNIIGSVN